MTADRPAFLRQVRIRDDAPSSAYPFGLPAVRGLDLALGAVTVLVGDNGSGKSTIVEALAVAAEFNAEGGGRNLRFETLATHSELHRHLELRWRRRPRWGWFLRAETFYGMASRITLDDDRRTGIAALFPDLHGRSHGQSFLALIESRFAAPGLYVMDEPESALSFQGQLQLLRVVHDGVAAGSQFVMATHSPILMRAAGATIYELGDHVPRRTRYDELTAVQLWRRFLEDPDRLLEVLYAEDGDDGDDDG
jgi:predicted ATPase